MATDPVCRMHVDEKTTTTKSKTGDKVVYFCCPSCKTVFDKNPSKYV